MPREEGIRYVCDRCNKEEFIAYRPIDNRYGQDRRGWTKVATTAKEEELWVCPDCSLIFADFLRDYLEP